MEYYFSKIVLNQFKVCYKNLQSRKCLFPALEKAEKILGIKVR